MKRLKLIAVAVGLALPWSPTTATVGAQNHFGQEQDVDWERLQRSWQMQAELARITNGKEAFIDELIQSWSAVLDPVKYGNLDAELRPVMRTATPWQLYAASLVGDFRGMVQVLQGKANAGAYINALREPQPKGVPMAGTNLALGTTTDSLVFTPISPCRLVDTRNSGARTGVLAVGVARVFDLTTDGLAEGQGGDTSCTGLPSFSYYGWSANITVTNYSVNGGLKAYPSGGSEPSSSIINFATSGPYALANAVTLTGCYACADDITLLAFGGSSHVIVDVLGYYNLATAFATGVVTEFAGTTTTVAAGAQVRVDGGACPAGTVPISGEMIGSPDGDIVTTNNFNSDGSPSSGDFWRVRVWNRGSSSGSVTVYTLCMTKA